MQSFKIWIALIVLPFFFIAAKLSDPGIRIKEQKANSTVYEIKLSNLYTVKDAAMLDSRFKAKMGILNSTTNPATSICTVEASNSLSPVFFRVIVESAGLVIAKSFE